VASCENTRGKTIVASQGFVEGRCQDWRLQLAKVRVARGASVSLAGGHARRVLTGKGAVPISRSRVSRLWKGRVGRFDLRTREIVSCDKHH
jgi:hypothetical protein